MERLARGGVVMLVGKPGIGKTRTAQEAEPYARVRGGQALSRYGAAAVAETPSGCSGRRG